VPTIASRQPSSPINMQVPSSPMVIAATGFTDAGSTYLQSSSSAGARAATESATSWTKQRATTRPWSSARSSMTRPAPNLAYLLTAAQIRGSVARS
jgi:hypothetical protein